MTRKHYVAVAHIIESITTDARMEVKAHTPVDPFHEGRLDALSTIADRLADFFSEDNNQFDRSRSRFLRACGWKE